MNRTKAIFAAIVLACGIAVWLGLSLLEDSYRERPFDLIEEKLYLGQALREPPPGTTAVVNLCGLPDPYQLEANLWEPVLEKGIEPTLEWLWKVTDFIDEQRRGGRTVYVHCFAGVNRSGAAMMAYLMREHGWSRDRALTFVQSKRPQVHPNPDLMRLLDQWGDDLRARAAKL